MFHSWAVVAVCPHAHLSCSQLFPQLGVRGLQRGVLLASGRQLLLGGQQGARLRLVATLQLGMLGLQGIQVLLQQAVALLQGLHRVHQACSGTHAASKWLAGAH